MDTTITNLEILPLGESKYLKPFKMKFKQNGLQRDWDCVKVMNSVSIFLYHEQKDAFLFVKQFRPAVWYSQEMKASKQTSKALLMNFAQGLWIRG